MLFIQFKQFGEIKSIVCMKSYWRRGQAFITFASLAAAQQAIDRLQGFILFDKPMRLNFAKSVSEISKPKEKRQPRRAALRPPGIPKEAANLLLELAAESDELFGPVRLADMTLKTTSTPYPSSQTPFLNPISALSAARIAQAPSSGQAAPPGPRLLLKNVKPELITEDNILNVLQQYIGFLNVKVVPSHAVAFAEFQTHHHATNALVKLGGAFEINGCIVSVEYAR